MTTLMCCIFLRFLLTNTLTTLDAKLTYMVQSNGLANVAWTAVRGAATTLLSTARTHKCAACAVSPQHAAVQRTAHSQP